MFTVANESSQTFLNVANFEQISSSNILNKTTAIFNDSQKSHLFLDEWFSFFFSRVEPNISSLRLDPVLVGFFRFQDAMRIQHSFPLMGDRVRIRSSSVHVHPENTTHRIAIAVRVTSQIVAIRVDDTRKKR